METHKVDIVKTPPITTAHETPSVNQNIYVTHSFKSENLIVIGLIVS